MYRKPRRLLDPRRRQATNPKNPPVLWRTGSMLLVLLMCTIIQLVHAAATPLKFACLYSISNAVSNLVSYGTTHFL